MSNLKIEAAVCHFLSFMEGNATETLTSTERRFYSEQMYFFSFVYC